MTNIKKFLGIIIVLVSINVLALNVVPQLQDDRTRQQAQIGRASCRERV